MSGPVDRCVHILRDLIAYRTENPGGNEMALCSHLGELLESHSPDFIDLAPVYREGSFGGYVFARWGQPKLIINVHVDTVPANNGWTRDPFDALVTEDRVVGLGAADTKGAIAATLIALEQIGSPPTDFGVLFSGDEERGSTVVRAFLQSPNATGIERAIVCEPTSRRMGIRHRGVRAYVANVEGKGGHSSKADFMPKPIVTMSKLAVEIDELGKSYLDTGPDDMKGVCMNVAGLDGGVAFNVVPDHASLSWSLRPYPGFDQAAYDAAQQACLERVDPAITMERMIGHAPFACKDPDWFAARLPGVEATPLDFWTEAAILSEHGIDAVVVGPGDIAHAHAADEEVTLADLGWAIELFTGAIAGDR